MIGEEGRSVRLVRRVQRLSSLPGVRSRWVLLERGQSLAHSLQLVLRPRLRCPVHRLSLAKLFDLHHRAMSIRDENE